MTDNQRVTWAAFAILAMLCLGPDIVPLHSQTKSSPTPKGILQGVFANHLKVLPFTKLIIGKVKFFQHVRPRIGMDLRKYITGGHNVPPTPAPKGR